MRVAIAISVLVNRVSAHEDLIFSLVFFTEMN